MVCDHLFNHRDAENTENLSPTNHLPQALCRSPGISRWGRWRSREERGRRGLKGIVRYEMGEIEERKGIRDKGGGE